MKKEELTPSQEKEKMIKSFKIVGKIVSFFKLFLLSGVIIMILSIVALVIVYCLSGMGIQDVGNEITVFLSELFEKNIAERRGVNEVKIWMFLYEIFAILSVYKIYDNLERIFKNTAKDATPFSLENIKAMKAIGIYAFICWACTSTSIINAGLIYVVAIGLISYIFKYGYELQKESDETL